MDFTNVRLEMGSPLSAPDFLKRPDIDDDLLFAILVLKRLGFKWFNQQVLISINTSS